MRLILLIFLFISFKVFSFQEHARVYFVDKPHAANLLTNPVKILSERSISRKKLHGIPIDERDVPVYNDYVSAIRKQEGIIVKARSKWFNCIHVLGSVENIRTLADFNFVADIFFADPRFNAGGLGRKEQRHQGIHKNKFEEEVLYDYGATTAQNGQINLQALHSIGFTGKGMQIAVLDAGFTKVNTMKAFQYMRNNNHLLGGYDFVNRSHDVFAYDQNSHGTQVLSVMAAFIEGEYVGTAPDAGYFLFRTEEAGQETPAEESYWVEAAELSDSLGVDILNTSLGYSTFDNPNYNYHPGDMDGETTFISKGAQIALDKGMLVVTSAGNEGNNRNWKVITAPADVDGLTVGAVDAEGTYASFSSVGPATGEKIKPDVMARGVRTAIVLPDDSIRFLNGTSFSSPVVAGATACLWQANLSKSNREMMKMIRQSGHLFDDPNNEYGYGIPDFSLLVTTAPLNEEAYSGEFNIFPNPTKGKFHVVFPENIFYADIDLYDVLGKWVYRKKISSINNEVNIGHLNSGVYIAKISSKNTKRILKIIKQ